MLVEQPHRLGRIDDRTSAEGNDQIRMSALKHGDTSADRRLIGLWLHFAENLDAAGAKLAPHLVDDSTLLVGAVGDHHD